LTTTLVGYAGTINSLRRAQRRGEKEETLLLSNPREKEARPPQPFPGRSRLQRYSSLSLPLLLFLCVRVE